MAKNESSSTEAATAKKDAEGSKNKKNLTYPPYVNAFGSIPKLFAEIKKASVPPKFTQDFLETALELKSSSHRALIPLLKKLELIDAANVPTEAYKKFRDDDHSRSVLAESIRRAYAAVFAANEYAYKLSREELNKKLRSLLGAADDDPVIPAVSGSMYELFKLADFESADAPKKNRKREIEDDPSIDQPPQHHSKGKAHTLGISYTINLNLPATTDIQVFNSIFKALKENILDEK